MKVSKQLRIRRRLCDALGLKPSTFYKLLQPPEIKSVVAGSPRSHRALTEAERQAVINVLHEPRFMDKAPPAIYAALLDEGRYLCSIRTMYRILCSLGELRERRNQLRHPTHAVPRLVATRPNQVWTWDITQLKGPRNGNRFYLYVILDIYSRYAVGWMVASRESGTLAKQLISETCSRNRINRKQLTVHSDRGAPMKSQTLALLLSELGITKSFSRPRVSNDNPYSESNFKTLKSHHLLPERFGCIQDARAHCRVLLDWYNKEHYHAGIALLTPQVVHEGRATACIALRQNVLDRARLANPERFVSGPPKATLLPELVWINEPQKSLALD